MYMWICTYEYTYTYEKKNSIKRLYVHMDQYIVCKYAYTFINMYYIYE